MTNSSQRAVQSLAKMTAVILAGGLGTSLRQVIADRPNVLAEVQGRPMLAYLLQRLVRSGVSYAVLCTGHMGEQVQATFGESYGGLRLAYSKESSPLGTAGALRLALPLLESDSVLVMNGDSLCDVNLSSLCARHRALKAEGTIVVTELPDTGRYGAVRVDPEGFVVSFDEKVGNHGPGWINAGTYLLNRSLIESIPADYPYSLERQMFPIWIKRGLYGYRFKGRFLDIGTPESYALVESFVRASPTRRVTRATAFESHKPKTIRALIMKEILP